MVYSFLKRGNNG